MILFDITTGLCCSYESERNRRELVGRLEHRQNAKSPEISSDY